MNIATLLHTLSATSIRLEVRGVSLLAGPRSALTPELDEALRCHKAALVALVEAWGWPAALHAGCFLFGPEPRLEPFELSPGRRVTDPATFYARLTLDTLAGPGGPRARTGALQEDLEAVFRAMGEAASSA